MIVAAGRLPTPLLRPEPGPAQDLLRRELARAEYQPSLVERVRELLGDLLDRAGRASGRLADLGWPVLVLLLVVLVAVAVLVLSRLRRNPIAPTARASVFDDVRRTAAEHRRLAEAAAADGDWDTAVVEAVRALSAGLVERDLVPDDPTVTAQEVTTLVAPRFPELAGDLAHAALTFDETRYGGRSADRARATACLDLDRAVAGSEPVAGTGGPVLAVPR